MKIVSEHLGEVLLAVLGVGLVVTVIFLCRTETHGFISNVIDKFQAMANSFFERIS